MFKKLVLQILAFSGHTQTSAADQLNYTGVAAFQSAIKNKDIKLSVLANICKLCNFDIIITNNKNISISVLDYINENKTE